MSQRQPWGGEKLPPPGPFTSLEPWPYVDSPSLSCLTCQYRLKQGEDPRLSRREVRPQAPAVAGGPHKVGRGPTLAERALRPTAWKQGLLPLENRLPGLTQGELKAEKK